MRLEHWPQEKLEQELKTIIGKYLDLSKYKLFFFGSRVTGKGDERSDIDVGIEGPKPVPYRIISQIQEDLEEKPILYSIDIVDFTGASEKFRHIGKQSTEYLS